jgi:hypothetical protein
MFEEEQEPEFEIFSALLFNSLKAITFMFFISFAMINEPGGRRQRSTPRPRLIITVTWPDNNPDDVDTYVGWTRPATSPGTTSAKAGLMNLERDDRGMFKDVILLNDKSRFPTR